MRSQEWSFPHTNPMISAHLSHPTLHATGSIPPLHVHELQQASSRVIVYKQPRVLHRYQLDQPSKRLELDPLAQKQSIARRVLSKALPSCCNLQLHLVGNVIPHFLPPLWMGYLLWDLSPISERYRDREGVIEIGLLQSMPYTMEYTRRIGRSE